MAIPSASQIATTLNYISSANFIAATAGKGAGICFKTGESTCIGQIANLAASAIAAETPLSQRITFSLPSTKIYSAAPSQSLREEP